MVQSVGWPCCVTCVANWFSKGTRGVVMGIWCALMIIGDVVGIFGSSFMLQFGWGWSFVLPGLLAIGASALVFLFLIVHPADLIQKSSNGVLESSGAGPYEETEPLVDLTNEEDMVH